MKEEQNNGWKIVQVPSGYVYLIGPNGETYALKGGGWEKMQGGPA